jgi:hypothetical protein
VIDQKVFHRQGREGKASFSLVLLYLGVLCVHGGERLWRFA